jgi:N utilization substance protein B
MDMTGTDANQVISEFLDHRLRDGNGNGDDGAEETDGPYFKDIVLGVVKTQREIDPVLNEHLAKGWHLSRIDSILRAILRSAAYEITKRTDVPAKVIINEYLNIAHAFFDTEEPKVVNGILDALARAQRASEFKQEK